MPGPEQPVMLEAARRLAHMGMAVLPLHHASPRPSGGMVCSCGRNMCESPAKHPLPRAAEASERELLLSLAAAVAEARP